MGSEPGWPAATAADAGELAGELVVVANRLPVRRASGGGWRTSPGGLVSALVPLLRRTQGTWIGWTGQRGPAPAPFEHEGITQVPVPLSRREASEYYAGFCNGTLWPLYHDCARQPVFRRQWWESYELVNRRFAEAAAARVPEGGTVWVHDYHLQLVPELLRERRPDLRIGFFLHIPFPPQELFQQLPWAPRILDGLLGADVLGFQTRMGADNFGRLARAHLSLAAGDPVARGGRLVEHRAFPISIDFEHVEALTGAESTRVRARRIRERVGRGRKLLLGVDRLDYTKGIEARLVAFRQMLDAGSAKAQDCVLVQIAVPSREQVAAYRSTRHRIEHLVGEINGRHGDVGRPAVHYLYKSLPFEELVAFYRAADVMLVTPLRDGMNLVAKEYVAARDDGHGVLVLSELAGAAQELREALLVNPHDVDGLASAMERALAASDDEQRERMQAMRATVRAHDVYDWALDFLDGLQHAPRAAAPAPRRGVALRALRDPDVPVDALGTRLLRRTRSDSTGTRA